MSFKNYQLQNELTFPTRIIRLRFSRNETRKPGNALQILRSFSASELGEHVPDVHFVRLASYDDPPAAASFQPESAQHFHSFPAPLPDSVHRQQTSSARLAPRIRSSLLPRATSGGKNSFKYHRINYSQFILLF